MKGGAHPSAFAALSFPNLKMVPNYCWVDRVSSLRMVKPALNSRFTGSLSAPKPSHSNHTTTEPLCVASFFFSVTELFNNLVHLRCMGTRMFFNHFCNAETTLASLDNKILPNRGILLMEKICSRGRETKMKSAGIFFRVETMHY